MICVRSAFTFGLAACLTGSSGIASADSRFSSKVDQALRQSLRGSATKQRVIITLKPGYRASVRASLVAHGDVISGEYSSVEALSGEVHSEDIDQLAAQSYVQSVTVDAVVRADSTGSNSDMTPSNLRQALGLVSVASSSTLGGGGIGVAIIDSGISPSSDFSNRITAFYDFTSGSVRSASPSDEYGHGTHVAGLIASAGTYSNYEFQGVAPHVYLIGLKVLDKDGQGRTSDVIAALEYVTANRTRLGVQVVNLSLGHPIFASAKDDPLVQAVERAVASGLVVVVSAGNFGRVLPNGHAGYTGITSPGNSPSAISVGSVNNKGTMTRDDDDVAVYSSRGPTWIDGFAKPDLVAPGSQLVSNVYGASKLRLLPGAIVRSKNGKDFLRLSGSSMSAAVASGVVALVLDASLNTNTRPLTPNAVKAILEYTAIPIAGADHLTQGAGEINAKGAVALAQAIDTSQATGRAWLTTGVTTATTIGTQTYEWAEAIGWGSSVIAGNNVLAYNRVRWGQSFVWGSDASDNIVWGSGTSVADDNIVWGSATVWATNIVWGAGLIGMADNDNIVWGSNENGDDNIVWGSLSDGDNIVWGALDGDNIVWSSNDADNIVWGSSFVSALAGVF